MDSHLIQRLWFARGSQHVEQPHQSWAVSHADREDKHNYTAVLKRPADISNQIKKEKDTENQAERADRKIRFRKCIFFF